MRRPGAGAPVDPVDPFDLPEWLGESQVTWTPVSGIASSHHVRGLLTGEGHELVCDLHAVDEAYPAPVADDDTRHTAHQAWHHGQVHLGSLDGRLTLLAPGTGFDADQVVEVMTRFVKALGATPDDFAVHLRLGD